MSITIKSVKTKCDLKKFISFPKKLYKNHPYWIPALDFDEKITLSKKTNPAFEFCEAQYWLAYKDNKVVGRIAGIINNKYIEIWKNKYARFGWIDFIDDKEVSIALLETVENWSKEKGMDGVQGPLGFSDFDKNGLLIEGFKEIGSIATIYNYPYYIDHLQHSNYKKEIDWVELKIQIPHEIPEKVHRIANIARKKFNLQVVPLKKSKDLKPYIKDVFYLLNDSYSHLFGFVPLTDKQMELYAKQYFSFIRPDFVCLVLDSQGKVASIGVTMPSLAKALQKTKGKIFPFGFIHLLRAMKKNNKADLFLIAVRKDLQGKGVNAILMDELFLTYNKNNIGVVEASPELETNKAIQSQWKYYDYVHHKKRRCYVKKFKDGSLWDKIKEKIK